MSWVLYFQILGMLLIGYILVVAGAAHLLEKRHQIDNGHKESGS